MAERYKQLSKTGMRYQNNCPVMLAASALLLDLQTHQVLAQLKLQSVVSKPINAVHVALKYFDPAGSLLSQGEFWFRDLTAHFSDQFGQKSPIYIEQDTVRSYTVQIQTVVFSNGDIWNISDSNQYATPLPDEEPLITILGEDLTRQFIRECILLNDREGGEQRGHIDLEQEEQYINDYITLNDINKIYRLKAHEGLVYCVCGSFYDQAEKTCPNCDVSREEYGALLDESYLINRLIEHQEHLRVLTEKEIEQKLLREEKEVEEHRIATEKQGEIKKCIRRLKAIIIPILLLIVLFIIINLAIIPSYKYKRAALLFEQKQYDSAASIFESLGGFKDSPEQAQLANNSLLYLEAENLLLNEEYDKAISIFENLTDFNDSSEQVSLAKYKKAEALLSDGKYDDAISAFKSLGSYNDASERVLKSTYEKADNLYKLKRYQDAAETFKTIEGYKDSDERKFDSYYKQAESLLENGETITAALTFYNIKEYKDAWKRCFDTWGILTNRESVSAGGDWTIGIKNNGQLVFTGSGYIFDERFLETAPELKNVASVSSSSVTTAVLMSDGTVKTFGRDLEGQIDTSYWEDIVAIETTSYSTFGLKADGTIKYAGESSIDNAFLDVIFWKNIVAIDGNDDVIVGLKSDGTVIAAGENMYSRDIEDWTDIKAVSAGNGFIVGLKLDGTVLATGANDDGQCNVSNWRDITAISARFYTTVGLKSDGTVVATGLNNHGQCEVSDWSNIEAIYCNRVFTVGLKSDGTVLVAGNWNDRSVDKWNSIVDISIEDAGEANIWNGRDLKHIVGLKSDGTVVAAGLNDGGQCNVSSWTSILQSNMG